VERGARSVSRRRGQDERDEADLIVYNAAVTTLDEQAPTAEAIAVKGKRIAAIGSSEAVLKRRSAGTLVVNAEGAREIARLNDSHAHYLPFGDRVGRLGKARQDRLRARSAPGSFVGHGRRRTG